MLYKKEEVSDPSSYRSIALINCIKKIFTQILSKRLTNWAEDIKLLPEFKINLLLPKVNYLYFL